MIVINLFSGPGCGKSTTAAGVFSLLKLHGVNAEYVPEFAKDLTWEERHKTLANQYYIWAKQYHRMWRLRDEVDVIVTDSPLLLTLMYGEICETHRSTVVSTFNDIFDNVNYFLLREKKYNPKGRSQTEQEAREIDTNICDMLDENNVVCTRVPGNFYGIDTITRLVLQRLGKKTKYLIDVVGDSNDIS